MYYQFSCSDTNIYNPDYYRKILISCNALKAAAKKICNTESSSPARLFSPSDVPESCGWWHQAPQAERWWWLVSVSHQCPELSPGQAQNWWWWCSLLFRPAVCLGLILCWFFVVSRWSLKVAQQLSPASINLKGYFLLCSDYLCLTFYPIW